MGLPPMIQPHLQTHSGLQIRTGPQPDSPEPASPVPPGVPSPDQKPEIGPLGEPPGVPSPSPGPQRDNDLPHTIDPLGVDPRGRAGRPVPLN
jgi:hypothetical protein